MAGRAWPYLLWRLAGGKEDFFSLLPCLISPTRQKQPKHARDQAPGNASSAIRPIVSSRRMWVNPILPQIHGIICRACPWRVRIWNSKASPLIYPNHCGGGLAIASFFFWRQCLGVPFVHSSGKKPLRIVQTLARLRIVPCCGGMVRPVACGRERLVWNMCCSARF